MTRFSIFAFCAGVLLAGVSGAEQTAVNVDLQPGATGERHAVTYAGYGPGGEECGDVWNAVAPPVDGYTSDWGSGGNLSFRDLFLVTNLLDGSGQKTIVSVSVERGDPLGTSFAVNDQNTWAFEHVAENAKDLMKDYLIAPGGGTNTLIISGLEPGSRCTLWLFGAGDQDTHQTAFRLGDCTRTTTGVLHEKHNLVPGGDYVVFDPVLVSADGSVTVHYSGVGKSRDGNFNGFQLRGTCASSAKAAPLQGRTP